MHLCNYNQDKSLRGFFVNCGIRLVDFCGRTLTQVCAFIKYLTLKNSDFFLYSEEDMKVAANFIIYFVHPEEKALRRFSDAISNNYLQSMPVYKNTLLRDGTSVGKQS